LKLCYYMILNLWLSGKNKTMKIGQRTAVKKRKDDSTEHRGYLEQWNYSES
jgi:hypothetical protein